ncbi:metallophosphoesterase [Dyella solisilvae]|uniref:Metallophosphoesterase n=1 Tax=Dyella solisilvae TaxID=1920168 RepID=A0A370KA81_9GAMM|nr:metallophosphoesterase [Dyella solisilvae]RDI98940.1 metallophosphoesterase [Dyella solisilvae]
MTQSPVQRLFDGPLDIVGDVHGEISALEQLLENMGYAPNGEHPAGRRLVFLGDLVDRGEDSPAVVKRVSDLVRNGLAQCVLGNHELNLLLDSRKEGNGWFYAQTDDHDHSRGHFRDAPRADASERDAILKWFSTLPLALEREDLRVVHACWHPPAINDLRDDARPVRDLCENWSERVEASAEHDGLYAARKEELQQWKKALHDPEALVPMLPAIAAIDARTQSMNPVKVLTSGLERQTSQPFFSNGRWRMTEREAWWNEYSDEPAVVFGHYWRWPGDEREATARSRGPNLFDGTSTWQWLGPLGNAMCVDYCAGLRWRERKSGVQQHVGLLAAVRWPERDVITSG